MSTHKKHRRTGRLESHVARERSYVDACAAAHALDLVGERWALLVVRELMFGPKRFTDLRAGIPDVSADVLGRRLRELEHRASCGGASCPRRRGHGCTS